MKKYITLVLEYDTDKSLEAIRDIATKDNCRAWSMDHEMLRVDLMRQAVEDGDNQKALDYAQVDGVIALRQELRNS